MTFYIYKSYLVRIKTLFHFLPISKTSTGLYLCMLVGKTISGLSILKYYWKQILGEFSSNVEMIFLTRLHIKLYFAQPLTTLKLCNACFLRKSIKIFWQEFNQKHFLELFTSSSVASRFQHFSLKRVLPLVLVPLYNLYKML